MLETIALARLAVGLLGERDQNGWWQSSFFGQGSNAFLTPVFPRTQLVAQFHGISAAAARIHDDRIGVGAVYHMFRLPEDLEQEIHHFLVGVDSDWGSKSGLASPDRALSLLRQNPMPLPEGAVGPIRVGSFSDLRDLSTWKKVAAYYSDAFDKGIQIYPYFSELT